MSRARSEPGMPAAFVDLSLCIVCILLAVLLISIISEPKKASVENVPPHAEYLIQLSWDDNSRDDIDLYVRGPDGNVVYFSRRQTPLMFLDADDLGLGNTMALPDGTTKTVPTRRETVTIRAVMPGEFCINAHEYRKNSPLGVVAHLVMTVTRLNPFSEITRATATFDTQGQEQTLANFTVAADGSVSAVYLAPVNLVGK